MTQETSKIAEVTPEHIQGLGTKYQLTDFTSEALDKILSMDTAYEAEPETAPAPEQPAPEVVQGKDEKPADTAPTEKHVSLAEKYYLKSNEANTEKQKREHLEGQLNAFKQDPSKFQEWYAKQTGKDQLEIANTLRKGGDGKVDMFDPHNQDVLTETMKRLVDANRELSQRVETLTQKEDRLEAERAARENLSSMDAELADTGIREVMGESFSSADLKWSRVWNELGAEKATALANDPAKFAAEYPHLELPKNLDAYFQAAKAVRSSMQLNGELSASQLLKAQGFKGSVGSPKPTPELAERRMAADKDLEVQGRVTVAPPNLGEGGKTPQELMANRINDVIAKGNALGIDKLSADEKAILNRALGID